MPEPELEKKLEVFRKRIPTGHVAVRQACFEVLSHIMNASCLMPHASCLMPHASCLMPHASCLMPHASCLMPHASCLMPHASYLIPHTSCPVFAFSLLSHSLPHRLSNLAIVPTQPAAAHSSLRLVSPADPALP